jgi:hypothetical protein
MVVRLTSRQSLAKLVNIQPEAGVRIHPHSLAIYSEPPFAQRTVEGREGTAQTAAGTALVIVRPQQRSQRVPAVAAWLDSQVGHQRECLAPRDVDWLVIALNTRRA